MTTEISARLAEMARAARSRRRCQHPSNRPSAYTACYPTGRSDAGADQPARCAPEAMEVHRRLCTQVPVDHRPPDTSHAKDHAYANRAGILRTRSRTLTGTAVNEIAGHGITRSLTVSILCLTVAALLLRQ